MHVLFETDFYVYRHIAIDMMLALFRLGRWWSEVFLFSKKESWNVSSGWFWAIYNDQTAEVTRNGGLVRESSQNGRVKDL